MYDLLFQQHRPIAAIGRDLLLRCIRARLQPRYTIEGMFTGRGHILAARARGRLYYGTVKQEVRTFEATTATENTCARDLPQDYISAE